MKMNWQNGIVFLLLFIFVSCREPRTATSCSGVNQSNSVNNSNQAADAAKDPHFFRRRKKIKGQDGFKQKDRKSKRSVKKAEKGKKQERKKTKAERKVQSVQKKQAAKKDSSVKEKKEFQKERTEAKEVNEEANETSAEWIVSKGWARIKILTREF